MGGLGGGEKVNCSSQERQVKDDMFFSQIYGAFFVHSTAPCAAYGFWQRQTGLAQRLHA